MFKSVATEEIQFPAEINSLKKLRDFVTRIGKKYKLTDKIINSFKLAVDEASTNIIRHAYRDKKGQITLRIIVRKYDVTVSLIDQGRYFDPKNVKDPDLKRYVNIGKKGGLGIFMIRKLVDDVDYRRIERGNELRLTNRRERKKSKFSLPSFTGSLRAKYFSFAAVIVSAIIVIYYVFNFITIKGQILDDAYIRMRDRSIPFAANILDEYVNRSEFNPELSAKAQEYWNQNQNFIRYVIITNLKHKIVGSSNPGLFTPELDNFNPQNPRFNVDEYIQVAMITTNQDSVQSEYFIVRRPIIPRRSTDNKAIGNTYILIPTEPIFAEVKEEQALVVQFFFLVLVIANASVGVLILLVFIPLQKLSTWVKSMGEGDIKDQVEIDSSDEIGKIAQAFSEITDKFRESQKSLVDQEKIQQEMHLAKEIQQTLLPAEFPEMEGYEIASYYESAKEVGGDYYDFVQIDRHRMGVVVADVSGKGVPGSLVMTMIRTALRTEAKGRGSSADVLSRVNQFVMDDIRKGMFVTLFYIILDSRRRRITFASAGHNPMILHRESTKKTYYLNPKGFPVGISLGENDLFKKSIVDDTIQLSKGDIILCYTDGITEAMNSNRELFGEERLLSVVREYGRLSAKQFVEKLNEEILSFTEGHIQNDDISLVVIKENMNPDEAELERAKQAYYKTLDGTSIKDASQEVGIALTTFNNKYKKQFEKMGIDRFKHEFETTSVEAKHLSIEEQTKIYDIIRKTPVWGPKRISEQLETEEYGFTKMLPWRIYDELVRKRLNTKQLREAYVARGDNKKRMKPPGTPMLTLDGRILVEEYMEPPITSPVTPVEVKPKEPEKEVVEQKPTKEEIDKKKPKSKKRIPLEDAEVSDYVLKDIVELLDKNIEDDYSKEVKEASEEQTEIETTNEPMSISAIDESNSEENPSEVGTDVKDLLDNLEYDEPKNEPDEDIDFSDLSTEEYTKELFDDRSNGDEQDDLEPEESIAEVSELTDLQDEESSEHTQRVEETEETAKQVLETLSAKIEGDADIDDSISASEDEEFIELISADADIEQVDVIEQSSEESTKELTKNTINEPIEESIVDSSDSELQQENKSDIVKVSKSPEEIFDELSVKVDEEENKLEEVISLNETPKLDENKIDDIFNMVSEDEEISLDSKEFASEFPKEENTEVVKKEADSVEEKKQKMIIVGGHYYMQKKYEKAISVFQRIIDKYPNTIEAYYNLGNSYFRINKWNEARDAYEAACELDPTFLDAMENLGVIYANQKEFHRAIDIWGKILEYDPKRVDLKKNIEKAVKLNAG
ncbi:SpoIIE family protein phosphatase [candidate division KSB1 bacterium]|nr:SpoIIE family protein phosphatase [candidate division KSB1 bacterium]